MKKVLIIVGPTATGKTALAAFVARRFTGELISADSRQVYKGMDLTTGKDRVDVPVWLYDVVNPDESFSVYHWVTLANEAISDIHSRNKLPIVVGGTGLYIKALLDPFETIHIPPNTELRKKLQHVSITQLHDMVVRGNMNDSDWNNPRRLIRKIEIAHSHATRIAKPQWNVFQIGLTAPLSILDARIDERYKARVEAGLYNEIDSLKKVYDQSLPAMSAIDLNEHAFARRQLTWFKKQQNIQWITLPYSEIEVEKRIEAWYTTNDICPQK